MTVPHETPPQDSAAARYLPFAAFMLFIGAEELLRLLTARGFMTLPPNLFLYLYPVRIALVVGILYSFRRHYRELRWADLRAPSATLATVGIGLVVFAFWISLDGWAIRGESASTGYNPFTAPPELQLPLLLVRVAGAVLVVPVMEELFWRSLLIRYIINPDFGRVAVGQFSWASFLITVVLFGLEHHLVVAGMVAGIFYNLLLYRTRSLSQCVLGHGITNAALAIYVAMSGRWDLW